MALFWELLLFHVLCGKDKDGKAPLPVLPTKQKEKAGQLSQ